MCTSINNNNTKRKTLEYSENNEVTEIYKNKLINVSNCKWNLNNQIVNSNVGLRQQVRIFLDKKPYKCDYKDCKKRFIRKDYLKRHLQTHFRKKKVYKFKNVDISNFEMNHSNTNVPSSTTTTTTSSKDSKQAPTFSHIKSITCYCNTFPSKENKSEKNKNITVDYFPFQLEKPTIESKPNNCITLMDDKSNSLNPSKSNKLENFENSSYFLSLTNSILDFKKNENKNLNVKESSRMNNLINDSTNYDTNMFVDTINTNNKSMSHNNSNKKHKSNRNRHNNVALDINSKVDYKNKDSFDDSDTTLNNDGTDNVYTNIKKKHNIPTNNHTNENSHYPNKNENYPLNINNYNVNSLINTKNNETNNICYNDHDYLNIEAGTNSNLNHKKEFYITNNSISHNKYNEILFKSDNINYCYNHNDNKFLDENVIFKDYSKENEMNSKRRTNYTDDNYKNIKYENFISNPLKKMEAKHEYNQPLELQISTLTHENDQYLNKINNDDDFFIKELSRHTKPNYQTKYNSFNKIINNEDSPLCMNSSGYVNEDELFISNNSKLRDTISSLDHIPNHQEKSYINKKEDPNSNELFLKDNSINEKELKLKKKQINDTRLLLNEEKKQLHNDLEIHKSLLSKMYSTDEKILLKDLQLHNPLLNKKFYSVKKESSLSDLLIHESPMTLDYNKNKMNFKEEIQPSFISNSFYSNNRNTNSQMRLNDISIEKEPFVEEKCINKSSFFSKDIIKKNKDRLFQREKYTTPKEDNLLFNDKRISYGIRLPSSYREMYYKDNKNKAYLSQQKKITQNRQFSDEISQEEAPYVKRRLLSEKELGKNEVFTLKNNDLYYSNHIYNKPPVLDNFEDEFIKNTNYNMDGFESCSNSSFSITPPPPLLPPIPPPLPPLNDYVKYYFDNESNIDSSSESSNFITSPFMVKKSIDNKTKKFNFNSNKADEISTSNSSSSSSSSSSGSSSNNSSNYSDNSSVNYKSSLLYNNYINYSTNDYGKNDKNPYNFNNKSLKRKSCCYSKEGYYDYEQDYVNKEDSSNDSLYCQKQKLNKKTSLSSSTLVPTDYYLNQNEDTKSKLPIIPFSRECDTDHHSLQSCNESCCITDSINSFNKYKTNRNVDSDADDNVNTNANDNDYHHYLRHSRSNKNENNKCNCYIIIDDDSESSHDVDEKNE